MTRIRHFITTRFWFWYVCVLTVASVQCARALLEPDEPVATITPMHVPVHALSANPLEQRVPR